MPDVPVSWVTYCADNPARGRWDQAHIARMLDGEEWRVPGGFTFVETPWTPHDGEGRVVIFPCGHYFDHEERQRALWQLQVDLAMLKWSVLIATSDEGSTFEWHKITLPSTCRLWVMTPRPENVYPEGTFFIGEGCPWSSAEVAAHAQPDWHKDLDVYFVGQINHARRERMWAALVALAIEEPELTVRTLATDGFTQGLANDLYLTEMCRAKVTPCPAGVLTQDSFRFFEALEAQCIPAPDWMRADGGGRDYWSMLFGDDDFYNWYAPSVWDIESLRDFVGATVDNFSELAARWSAWWQQYKRSLVYRLHRDVHHVMWDGWFDGIASHFGRANDDVTVIIPTSPTPSNPDISMIQATVASVRERLPTAEILITIDGVREEQEGQSKDYWEYARRLCAWTNTQPNICPFVYSEHMHQSGMMRDILTHVETSMILYVEHDTPLVGEIDFDACVEMMFDYELAVLRFAHEARILEEHEHLFLEVSPVEGTAELHATDDNFVRTVQWSQRPHLAGADWYRDLMATYFGKDSRTMIEDVMYGVVQHGAFTDRLHLEEAWGRWRLAVYAPPGDIKRSWHTDGRAGDPKYPMKFSYDLEEVPPGAPQPGTR